jgi:hypothetical protein
MIITVLHPRYKTEYFKKARWHAEWVATAIEVATNVYTSLYETRDIPSSAPPHVPFEAPVSLNNSQVRQLICFFLHHGCI